MSPNKKNPKAGVNVKFMYQKQVPVQALPSREDLYDLNMKSKIQVNGLKTENRKINTKLLVLENQLVQKDKLFEDMYRAAFSTNLQ